jgi:hypothetical protein
MECEDPMSEADLKELKKQLKVYTCLNSRYVAKNRKGKKKKGPDGKTVKVSAMEKHRGSSKLKSIMSRVCFQVNRVIIEKFFSNSGLRAAWEKVSPHMKTEKPDLIKYFDEIDMIRLSV